MNHERYQELLEEPFATFASGEIPIKPLPERKSEPEWMKGMDNCLDYYCREMTIWRWCGAVERGLPYYGFHYDMPALREAIEETQSKLTFAGARPYRRESIPVYQVMAMPSLHQEPLRPEYPSLYTLLEGVDAVMASDLLGSYYDMLSIDGVVDPNIRTLIEAALVIAKEVTRSEENLPSILSSRHLVPYVKRGGARFSAVLESPESAEGKNWVEPQKISGQPTGLLKFDFYRQEASLHPYDVLEIRTALTVGPRKVEKMLREEIGGFLRQLTSLTIWWYKNRKGDFPFPERLIITYFRGSSPHLFYSMPLNAWFFEQWINALETRRQNLRASMPKYENPLDLSTTQWTAAMQTEQEIPEVETFMDILIRRWKIIGLREQRIKDKGGEIETWRQWEMV